MRSIRGSRNTRKRAVSMKMKMMLLNLRQPDTRPKPWNISFSTSTHIGVLLLPTDALSDPSRLVPRTVCLVLGRSRRHGVQVDSVCGMSTPKEIVCGFSVCHNPVRDAHAPAAGHRRRFPYKALRPTTVAGRSPVGSAGLKMPYVGSTPARKPSRTGLCRRNVELSVGGIIV